MMKKCILFLVFVLSTAGWLQAQRSGTADLFKRDDEKSGKLTIIQDHAVDSLVNRYILMNIRQYEGKGMDGWRIQIYGSSNRNAREESRKVQAEFINSFPRIFSVIQYSDPGLFRVRVGDFRTKTEATKLYIEISRKFPDSFIVPDVINFPELNKN